MNNVKAIQKLNETELRQNSKKSWHDMYKGSAYIFIGGLDYKLTEGDILAVFSQCGEIVNINLVRERDTGKSKGFCFLAYEDQRSTVLAVDNLNGVKLIGKTLRVDHVQHYRRPKDEHGNDIIEKGCAPQTPPPSPSPSESSPSPSPSPPPPPPPKKKKKKQLKSKKKSKKPKKNKKKRYSSSYSESESGEDVVEPKGLRESGGSGGDSGREHSPVRRHRVRKDDEGDSVADRTGPERQYTHRRRASRSPDDGTTLTTTHRRRASRSPDERTTLTTTHRRRASRSPDERTTLSTTHRRIRSPDGAVKSRRELRGGGNAPSDDLKSDKHTRRRQSRSRSRSTERKHRTR